MNTSAPDCTKASVMIFEASISTFFEDFFSKRITFKIKETKVNYPFEIVVFFIYFFYNISNKKEIYLYS